MDKKMLIIGASITMIIVVAIIAVVVMPKKNKPANNTNIENENTTKVYQCSDGVDNDNDELIDEKDPGCHSDNDADNANSYDAKDDSEYSEALGSGSTERTLRDLFSGKLGTALKCVAVYKIGNNNEVKVTMYISEKGMRLDYELKNPAPGMGGQMQTDFHMISDGEYGYAWGNSTLGGMMQGFKIKLDDMDSEEKELPAGMEMIDFNMPVTDCTPWIVDEKMFEIPEGIKFIDPDDVSEEEIIKEILPPDVIEGACSACNLLPEEERAECFSSLGCN